MPEFRSPLSFPMAVLLAIALGAGLISLIPLPSYKHGYNAAERATRFIRHLKAVADVSTTEMASRPLFVQGRRPLAIPMPPKEPKLANLPVIQTSPPVATTAGFTLIGTMLSSGSQSALVRSPYTPGSKLVTPGDKLGPWTVEAVYPDHVHLRTATISADLKFLVAVRQQTGARRVTPPSWMQPGFQAQQSR
jgi:hypothetical protein